MPSASSAVTAPSPSSVDSPEDSVSSVALVSGDSLDSSVDGEGFVDVGDVVVSVSVVVADGRIAWQGKTDELLSGKASASALLGIKG